MASANIAAGDGNSSHRQHAEKKEDDTNRMIDQCQLFDENCSKNGNNHSRSSTAATSEAQAGGPNAAPPSINSKSLFKDGANTATPIQKVDRSDNYLDDIGLEHVDGDHDDIYDGFHLYSSPPPPSLPMTSPTMSAVKESTLQATFAEQTAMEMKEIMDWYHYKDSSVATPNPGATGTRSSGGGEDGDDGSNNNFESVMTPQSHFLVRNSLVDDDDDDNDNDDFGEWDNNDTNGVAPIMTFPGSDHRSRSDVNQSDAGSHSVSIGDDSDSASIDDPHHAALIQTVSVTPTRPIFQLPAEVKGNLEARTQQREVDRLCNITQEMEDIAKALPQHDGNDDSSLDFSLSSLLSLPFPLQLPPYHSGNGTGNKKTPVKELDNIRDTPNNNVSPLSVSSSQSDQERKTISIRSRWYNNFQHYLLRRKADTVTAAIRRKPSKAKIILNKTKSNIVVFAGSSIRHIMTMIMFMLKLYIWGFIHSLALFYFMVDIIISEFAFEIALVGIFLFVRKQM